MRLTVAFILIAVISMCSLCGADEIYFTNGDILTGTITAIGDGKITVKTPEAGEVKVPLSSITTFSTTKPIDIRLSNGSIIHAKLSKSSAGQVMSHSTLQGTAPIKLGNLTSFPPVLSPVWTGSVKFGGLLVRGNASSESVNLAIGVDRKTTKDELSFAGSYLYGRTKDRITGVATTANDNWQTEAKYQYNLTKKLYDYADIEVKKDRLAFLDLQVVPSVGLGYHWVNKPTLAFATEAGIAWVYQTYTNNTPTRENISLKLAYHLTKKFNDKVSLIHNLNYTPSIENGRDFLVETDVELKTLMTKHWFTDLKIELDYNNNPANGALKTDTRYELDLGYTL